MAVWKSAGWLGVGLLSSLLLTGSAQAGGGELSSQRVLRRLLRGERVTLSMTLQVADPVLGSAAPLGGASRESWLAQYRASVRDGMRAWADRAFGGNLAFKLAQDVDVPTHRLDVEAKRLRDDADPEGLLRDRWTLRLVDLRTNEILARDQFSRALLETDAIVFPDPQFLAHLDQGLPPSARAEDPGLLVQKPDDMWTVAQVLKTKAPITLVTNDRTLRAYYSRSNKAAIEVWTADNLAPESIDAYYYWEIQSMELDKSALLVQQ